MFSNNLFQKDYQSYLNHIWGDAELGGGAEGGGQGREISKFKPFPRIFMIFYQISSGAVKLL